MDAVYRDVWVDVAAAQEDRRTFQRARVVKRLAFGPDKTARERYHTSVTAGISGGELESQAGPLREAHEHDSLLWNDRADGADRCSYPGEGRGEPGLVQFDLAQKAVRIPRKAGGLRSEKGRAWCLELRCQC